MILKSSVEDDTDMKQIDDEKQVDGIAQGKELSNSSRTEVVDIEMTQIDHDENPDGDGMSQGKESNASSTSSRMESVRNGK